MNNLRNIYVFSLTLLPISQYVYSVKCVMKGIIVVGNARETDYTYTC